MTTDSRNNRGYSEWTVFDWEAERSDYLTDCEFRGRKPDEKTLRYMTLEWQRKGLRAVDAEWSGKLPLSPSHLRLEIHSVLGFRITFQEQRRINELAEMEFGEKLSKISYDEYKQIAGQILPEYGEYLATNRVPDLSRIDLRGRIVD